MCIDSQGLHWGDSFLRVYRLFGIGFPGNGGVDPYERAHRSDRTIGAAHNGDPVFHQRPDRVEMFQI
jgi:hypothetical protein